MTNEVKQALIESATAYLIYYYFIQGYKEYPNAVNEFDDDFADEHMCSLCAATHSCSVCPVYEHTNQKGCRNTPFDDLEKYAERNSYRWYRRALYREYEFLASLLD